MICDSGNAEGGRRRARAFNLILFFNKLNIEIAYMAQLNAALHITYHGGGYSIRASGVGSGDDYLQALTDWGLDLQDKYAQWEEEEQDRKQEYEIARQKAINVRRRATQYEEYLADEKRINAEFDAAPKRRRRGRKKRRHKKNQE